MTFYNKSLSSLELAKAQIDMPRLAACLSISDKYNPGKSYHVPWRKDKNPSLIIWSDGKGWIDMATGEKGDVISFLEYSYGLSRSDAVRELMRLSGVNGLLKSNRAYYPHLASRVSHRAINEPKKALLLPDIRSGTTLELNDLAKLRNLSINSLKLASEKGLLWFASIQDGGENVSTWILTDSARRNAQARRLDGNRWQHIPSNPKSKTLPCIPGDANWPIGAADIGDCPIVALCEGGPDFLSAFHFASNEGKGAEIAPVFMAGAALNIHRDSWPWFTGKIVIIFTHLDPSGKTAAEKWSKQLYKAGSNEVVSFCFDGLYQYNGKPVCDLNDLTRQDVDCWEKNYDSHEVFNILPD